MRLILALCFSFSFAQAASVESALAYLAKEVPFWRGENGCFSCHNNGDGARALYLARQSGYSLPATALVNTEQWLTQPGQWDQGKKSGGSSDLKLARLQFFAALAASKIKGPSVAEAASIVLRDQDPSGAWIVDTGSLPGGPVTWGTSLATALTLQSLRQLSGPALAPAILRGETWLRNLQAQTLLDQSAILLAFPKDSLARRQLLAAQSSNGGWALYKNRPPEVFDTALAILALAGAGEQAAVERGRAYLLSQQLENGAWPETTRPSGAQSYAHTISTSAWATLALLALQPKR